MEEELISRQMAEFVVRFQYKDISKDAVNEVKRYLYGSIGCAYGAYRTGDMNIIREIYRQMGGKEEATVIGFGEKIPAVNATLINSLMIRSLDFNDIYWKEAPCHPSDLIPAALATGTGKRGYLRL